MQQAQEAAELEEGQETTHFRQTHKERVRIPCVEVHVFEEQVNNDDFVGLDIG